MQHAIAGERAARHVREGHAHIMLRAARKPNASLRLRATRHTIRAAPPAPPAPPAPIRAFSPRAQSTIAPPHITYQLHHRIAPAHIPAPASGGVGGVGSSPADPATPRRAARHPPGFCLAAAAAAAAAAAWCRGRTAARRAAALIGGAGAARIYARLLFYVHVDPAIFCTRGAVAAVAAALFGLAALAAGPGHGAKELPELLEVSEGCAWRQACCGVKAAGACRGRVRFAIGRAMSVPAHDVRGLRCAAPYTPRMGVDVGSRMRRG